MKIDCIITSRLRPDYLDQTLEALFKHNATSLNNVFVYEDSEDTVNFLQVCMKHDVIPIFGGGNKGQVHAIDTLLSYVNTELYLHLEDDWVCNEFGFIPEAVVILCNPNIIQVNGRGRAPKALNGHPTTEGILSNDYMGWSGWMYAPTVNRLSDYKSGDKFSFITRWNPKTPWECEKEIGLTYHGNKYVTEKTYFTHIGAKSTLHI